MEKETGMLFLQQKLAGKNPPGGREGRASGAPLRRQGREFGESGGGLVHGLYFGA